MSGILNRIVDVNITRGTRGIASANFSTPLLVTKTATSRIAVYGSAKEVSDAGYAESSVEYLGALAHFTQDNYPAEFKIGQWDTSGAETLSQAMDAIFAEDNQWYGICLGHVDTVADYTTLAVWAKVNGKFVFAGDASGTQATSTALNSATANKACVMENSKLRDAGEGVKGFADVAFCSAILGQLVGSYTTDCTKLKSTYIDSYTTAQMNSAFNQNANFFHQFYSVNITEEGRVTDGNTPRNGEWIDVEIGLDWLETRIQEAIFKTIVNSAKIPYTDEGTNTLEVTVAEVLKSAKDNGFLADYTTTREPVSEQSDQDKADRKYNGLSWEATLANAVHTVTINGNVSV